MCAPAPAPAAGQPSVPLNGVSAGTSKRPVTEQEAEEMAAEVWKATWPVERVRQRAFFTFGMEMLLTLNLHQTREFFAAFFSLSDFHWYVIMLCCMCGLPWVYFTPVLCMRPTC